MRFSRIPFLALLAAGVSLPAFSAQNSFQGKSFQAHVVRQGGAAYREFRERGESLIKVRPDESYQIVVRNPLPVRVAVAVSVDGLNSIDGERTSPGKARKWIIEPHGSLTVKGWQTGKDKLREFVFTRPEKAYTSWRDKRENTSYSKNMGVIGVAWFWNAEELDRVLNPPKPFEDEAIYHRDDKKSIKAPSAEASSARKAGTGMGDERANRVTRVKFVDTAGMYKVKDVLKIYYEFAEEEDSPQPFIDEAAEKERFAPEMP